MLAGFLAACGSDSSAPGTPADVSGSWKIGWTISNSSIQMSCRGSGTLVLNQGTSPMAGYLSAGASCTTPHGSTSGVENGSVSGGSVNGQFVSFAYAGGCQYSGVATGSPASKMKGTLDCTATLSGKSYRFTGTWTATR